MYTDDDNLAYSYYDQLLAGTDTDHVAADVPTIGPAPSTQPGTEQDPLGIFYILNNNTASPINVSFLNPNNTTFLSSSNTYLYSGFTFPVGWDGITLVVNGSTVTLTGDPVVYANVTALVADLNLYGGIYGTWSVASGSSISVTSTYELGLLTGIGVEDFTPAQTGTTGITFAQASYPYTALLQHINGPFGFMCIRNMKVFTNSTSQSQQPFTIAYQGDFGQVLNYTVSPIKYMDGGLFQPTILDIPVNITAGKQNINFTMLAGSSVGFVFDLVKLEGPFDREM